MSGSEDLYQKYLEKKHGTFQTPQELIETVVKKATGSEPIQRNRIIAGEVNEVYSVITEDKQDVIVRISRQGKNNFEAEEQVIRLARMAGVPAPKVLLIEQASSGLESLTFCVEEKIEGEPLLSLMGSMDKSTFKSIVLGAGEILSKIHGIVVDKYGPQDGSRFFETWGDYIFNIEKRRVEITAAAKLIGIESGLVGNAFKLLWENKEMFKIDEPHLLHGDFGPKHLLIVDNHITGILDFESAKGGDPIRDLAWLNFFYDDSFSIDWLKEGYQNKDIFDENFDLKMKLYRLHLGLDLLEYYGSEKNKSGMIHTKERLIKELENF